MNSDPIFIIGYMACGKTTFGRALAKTLGKQFIDLDFFIEQRFRKSISEIFNTRGEDAFRKIEANMLRETAEMLDVVIACGGGTPCFFDNIDFMNSKGTTVFLTASPERILARLMANSARRPLMAGKSEQEIRARIDADMKLRLPFYSKAKITHIGENLESKAQIARAVEDFVCKIK